MPTHLGAQAHVAPQAGNNREASMQDEEAPVPAQGRCSCAFLSQIFKGLVCLPHWRFHLGSLRTGESTAQTTGQEALLTNSRVVEEQHVPVTAGNASDPGQAGA